MINENWYKLPANFIKSESDGVFGLSACPSWGWRMLRFRLMVDVVCVEQPQASREKVSIGDLIKYRLGECEYEHKAMREYIATG